MSNSRTNKDSDIVRAPGKQFEFDTLYRDDKVGIEEKFGSIKLYQIGEVSCVNGYEIRPHKQWCHEISYVISGEGIFTTNNETNLLIEGDIQFSPRGSIHAIKTESSSDLRYAYIGFDFDSSESTSIIEEVRQFYTTTNIYKCSSHNEITSAIFQNLDEIYNKSELYEIMVQTYLLQILIMVYRSFKNIEPKPGYLSSATEDNVGRAVYAIIRYIDHHIYDKLEVKQISPAVGYNYSYISNLFKKTTGITLQKYISDKKIQKAIELMKIGKFSITEISNRLSYSNVQVFNKVFRRTMGVAPTKFIEDYNKNVQYENT